MEFTPIRRDIALWLLLFCEVWEYPPRILRIWKSKIEKKEEGRRKREEGSSKQQAGSRKKEEGRGKRKEGRNKIFPISDSPTLLLAYSTGG